MFGQSTANDRLVKGVHLAITIDVAILDVSGSYVCSWVTICRYVTFQHILARGYLIKILILVYAVENISEKQIPLFYPHAY